jgi:tetratricopeptide (TPR) repeat protein
MEEIQSPFKPNDENSWLFIIMEKESLSPEQIDSVISLLSIGKFQDTLGKTAILDQKFPGESLLSNISGACYQGLGQFDNAVKYYEKAITINASYYKAHYKLGGVFQDLGKLPSKNY